MDSFDHRHVAVRSAHFIAGQYRDAPSGMEVSRPSDGQPYAELPIASSGARIAPSASIRSAQRRMTRARSRGGRLAQ